MKTRYRFIHFTERDPTLWVCRNNKTLDALAAVSWYKPWGQWVFFTGNDNAVFSHDCLTDISDFLKQLNETKKSK